MTLPAAIAEPAVSRRSFVLAGAMVLLIALLGLAYYKWTGAYVTVAEVRTSGVWSKSADAVTAGGLMATTLQYFGKVWLALVFGILIGAAVRAAISPKFVVSLLGRGGALRRHLTGGLAGAPLMLCSCCVSPIFTGMVEGGARLGPALSLMLASPGLNVAALALTFMLFPLDLSLARLGAALAAVFLLPWVLERMFGGRLKAPEPPRDDSGPRSLGDFAARFVKSAAYLTIVTVPLIIAGVVVSGLILPLGLGGGSGGAWVTLLIVAAVSVLVALPTFFEIPLALLLMQTGAPGAAAAMLFAGPIVNLPSLLVLGRETNGKVAAGLTVGVWVLAVLAGAAVGR
ncbi:MAG: permease [Planctomycetes bacterium]|nr:permease [Planctomycetota bacterium]